jgi:hypothetical protein
VWRSGVVSEEFGPKAGQSHDRSFLFVNEMDSLCSGSGVGGGGGNPSFEKIT